MLQPLPLAAGIVQNDKIVAAAAGCGRRSAIGGIDSDLSEVGYRRK